MKDLEIRTVSSLFYATGFLNNSGIHLQVPPIHTAYIYTARRYHFLVLYLNLNRSPSFFPSLLDLKFFFLLRDYTSILSDSILFHLTVAGLRSPIFHTPFLFSKWRTLKSIYIALIITSSLSHKYTAICEFASANSHSS